MTLVTPPKDTSQAPQSLRRAERQVGGAGSCYWHVLRGTRGQNRRSKHIGLIQRNLKTTGTMQRNVGGTIGAARKSSAVRRKDQQALQPQKNVRLSLQQSIMNQLRRNGRHLEVRTRWGLGCSAGCSHNVREESTAHVSVKMWCGGILHRFSKKPFNYAQSAVGPRAEPSNTPTSCMR